MSEARRGCPGAALYWNDQSDLPLDWNGPIDRPFDAFPDESKARPIVELLEVVVRHFPERIALCAPEVSITYIDLWRALTSRAEQIAGATAPGDLVGILAPVSATLPIAMLACLAAGRPFVVLAHVRSRGRYSTNVTELASGAPGSRRAGMRTLHVGKHWPPEGHRQFAAKPIAAGEPVDQCGPYQR